jgi:membrane fusion protein (multidrug efflux system)
MRKRMFTMVAIFLLVVATLGFVKFMQIKSAMAAWKNFSMPPEAVTTIVARPQPWASTIDAVGSVSPVQGVTLSADLPGVVEKVEFESGSRVAEGAPLVVLDTRQERAQLASAEAANELAKANLKRSKALLDQQLIAQADYDGVAALEKQAEASANLFRATIARKTIRAPFAGVAGIRQVNAGQYVNSGDPIVPLQSTSSVYVNFAVPQSEMGELKAGSSVTITAEGARGTSFTGRVNAINPVVDEQTRNVQVQALLKNPNGAIKPGMYVSVSVNLGARNAVIALPASAINYAPYGNSVFIVEMMTDPKNPKSKPYKGVRQQFVQLGATQGDLVSVTSGVKPGEEIVTSGVFKLRSGASVQVNNQTKPSASSAPKPADT